MRRSCRRGKVPSRCGCVWRVSSGMTLRWLVVRRSLLGRLVMLLIVRRLVLTVWVALSRSVCGLVRLWHLLGVLVMMLSVRRVQLLLLGSPPPWQVSTSR